MNATHAPSVPGPNLRHPVLLSQVAAALLFNSHGPTYDPLCEIETEASEFRNWTTRHDRIDVTVWARLGTHSVMQHHDKRVRCGIWVRWGSKSTHRFSVSYCATTTFGIYLTHLGEMIFKECIEVLYFLVCYVCVFPHSNH